MKKKLLLPVLFAIITIRASSQTQFGIIAGPQFATRNYPEEIDIRAGFITTANAGVTSFFPLTKELSLHETFGYSGKGVILKKIQFVDNLGNDVGNGNINILVNYIELKSSLVYKTGISSGVDLIAGGGPYFAYAVGGRTKITGDNAYSNTPQRKEKIDFEHSGYKRFDFGLNTEVGIEIKNKILMSLSADFGFTEVVNSFDRNIRNTSLSFTIGYLLTAKKKEQKRN